MAGMLYRKQLLLAKIEVSEGTDPTPTGSANAILVENIRWSETPNVIQTNEHLATLDLGKPVIGGIRTSVSFSVWAASRSAGDTVPELGPLLRACGFAETQSTATVPSGGAEALASGAATTTCTLGSTATGTANLYTGMPITFTSTVTGTSFIAAYTAAKLATLTDTMGGTLTTTTNYLIEKNVVYRPTSASIPSVTLYLYRDGKLLKGLGARGTFTMNWTAGGGIRFDFTFQAVWQAATDTSMATPTFQNGTKIVWRGEANSTSRMRWNRILCAASSLTIDAGNSVVQPDNPEAIQGYDPALITMREPSGSFNPLEVLVATRDIFSDMAAGTTRILHARAGSSAGSRIAVTSANTMATANNQGDDRDGLSAESITFRCTGADDGFSITFW
jgi:hypothetical protein